MRKIVKKNGKPLKCPTYSQEDMDNWKADVKAAENAYEDMRTQRDAAVARLHAETERANAACRKLALLRTIVEQA